MIARLKTSYQNGDLAFKFDCQNSPTHHEDQNGRSLKHCGLYHLLLYYYYNTSFPFQCSCTVQSNRVLAFLISFNSWRNKLFSVCISTESHENCPQLYIMLLHFLLALLLCKPLH